MRVLFFSILVIGFQFHTSKSLAEESPVALVYRGLGSCSGGCSEADAAVARMAGLNPVYVGPNAINKNSTPADVAALFTHVKVWMQPGGSASAVHNAMTPELSAALINFIHEGGGYFGTCAGAFLATSLIGETGRPGLGIFPGFTRPFQAPKLPNVKFSMEKVIWEGVLRILFFENGPLLYGYKDDPNVEVIGTYDSGDVAAARTQYGKGRVFISGPHPEAPQDWSQEDGITDPDGSDQAYAAKMVMWVAQLTK